MINVSVSNDHHINSNTGLLGENAKIEPGRAIPQTEYQHTIYKYFLDYCDRFTRLPGEKIIIFNGDIFDIDCLGEQRISANTTDIIKMGLATLEPLLSIDTKYRFVVRGTDKHGNKFNSLEEDFAMQIGAIRNQDDGSYAWWHLRQNIHGVNFNVGHHISIGQSPWTEANSALSKLVAITEYELRQGYPIPDLVFRGHVHTPIDTGSINPLSRLIIVPSWQGKNSHAYKVALDKPTYHGASVAQIKNSDEYDVVNYIYKPKKDTVWTL